MNPLFGISEWREGELMLQYKRAAAGRQTGSMQTGGRGNCNVRPLT